MRIGTLVAVAGVVLAVGGCGDGGGGSSDLTAEQVNKAFMHADGQTLITLDDDEVWTMLVPDPKDPGGQDRYGPFTIYVIKKDGGEDTLKAGTTVKDGILWKKDGDLWTMLKSYAGNVWLQYAGLPEQTPPAEGFPDVDENLSRLASGDL
jgi:hypothetical protein